MRGVLTWREAHRILVKLEEADSSSRALVGAVGTADGGGGGGGRRGRGKKGAKADPELAPVGESGGDPELANLRGQLEELKGMLAGLGGAKAPAARMAQFVTCAVKAVGCRVGEWLTGWVEVRVGRRLSG